MLAPTRMKFNGRESYLCKLFQSSKLWKSYSPNKKNSDSPKRAAVQGLKG